MWLLRGMRRSMCVGLRDVGHVTHTKVHLPHNVFVLCLMPLTLTPPVRRAQVVDPHAPALPRHRLPALHPQCIRRLCNGAQLRGAQHECSGDGHHEGDGVRAGEQVRRVLGDGDAWGEGDRVAVGPDLRADERRGGASPLSFSFSFLFPFSFSQPTLTRRLSRSSCCASKKNQPRQSSRCCTANRCTRWR